MKVRTGVDGSGNVYVEEWADDDYPPEYQNEDALTARAEQAMDGLRQYIDNNNPTPGNTVMVVKLICRVLIALIRLQLRQLDGTD